jgi:hypothetical protein
VTSSGKSRIARACPACTAGCLAPGHVGHGQSGGDYTYSFKTQHGWAMRVHTQKWADTAWNGDGQNKRDGNISGR